MVEQVREIKIAEVIRETTSEERTWAALAHASGLLTLFMSFSTVGLGGVPFAFVPLIIYIVYREKSRYVAFHAAQAFALQIAGTVGFFVFMLLGTLVAALITAIGGVLLIILVGVLVLIIAALLWVVVAAAYPLVPLMLGVFAAIAAAETWNGRDYRYPYIGAWVEDWLRRQAQEPTPAV